MMMNGVDTSIADASEQRCKTQSSRLGLVRDLFIFWFVIFLVVLCWTNNILVTTILIAAYGVRYYFWPNKEDHVLYIGGALLGPIAEIIATKVGIWQYTLPTFLNIPLWLPFAWGFAAVLIIRIALAFVKK
jgi:hypothetical protein